MRVLIEDIRSNRDSWIANKANTVGSGDAYEACTNPLNLYLKKKGLLPDSGPNAFMEWGQRLESEIAKKCLDELQAQGRSIEPVDLNTCYQHRALDWMVATPDFAFLENGELHLIECKMVTPFGAHHWADGISDRAHVQVHHQLEVCHEAKSCVVAALIFPAFDFFTYEIRPDEQVQNLILSRESEFWGYFSSSVLPPLNNPSGEALSAVFPKSNGEAVTLSHEHAALIDEYTQIAADHDRLGKAKTTLTNKLKLALGENRRGSVAGKSVTWFDVHKSSFDQKAFEKDHPDLAKQYRRNTSYRSLRVNGGISDE